MYSVTCELIFTIIVRRAPMSIDPDTVNWFRGAEGDENSTDGDQNNNVLFLVVLIPVCTAL